VTSPPPLFDWLLRRFSPPVTSVIRFEETCLKSCTRQPDAEAPVIGIAHMCCQS
jgi:hypothetical protein